MVSRLSTDHVKHDNRIEAVLLFLKISFLNNPDKEAAAAEYTLELRHSLVFTHGRCACDWSAVRLFSCHCRHSINLYNKLINNVLVKNVKSDSK